MLALTNMIFYKSIEKHIDMTQQAQQAQQSSLKQSLIIYNIG